MIKIILLFCFVCLSATINAQEFKNTRTYIDASNSSMDSAQLQSILTYFTKQVREGKIIAYKKVESDGKEIEVPLSIAAFDSACQYTILPFTQQDPLTLEEKTIDKISKSPINKIRVLTDMVFNTKTKKMEAHITELDFLAGVVTSENILLGYKLRFYIPF